MRVKRQEPIEFVPANLRLHDYTGMVEVQAKTPKNGVVLAEVHSSGRVELFCEVRFDTVDEYRQFTAKVEEAVDHLKADLTDGL